MIFKLHFYMVWVYYYFKSKLLPATAQVLLLQWMRPVEMQWQLIELFSGVGNVSKAFRDRGFAVCSYDRVNGGKHMDFETASGFASGTPGFDQLNSFW